jgi:Rab-like protein 5
MANNYKTVKILVVGPSQSGKSAISDFISERNTTVSSNYRPTAGVRIIEFERDAPHNPKKPATTKTIVELWDGTLYSLTMQFPETQSLHT